MSDFNSKSSALQAQATFNDMLEQFGVVTVMNAKVFKKPLFGYTDGRSIIAQEKLAGPGMANQYKAHDVLKALLAVDPSDYVVIDTLKIANISMEGPTKTITGGQYVNPLIKFGKTATIEMQDALGRAEVIEALGGGIIETFGEEQGISRGYTNVLHLTQDFAGAKVILGDSFFIDKATGAQVKVYIILYEMLPDSIFNLTQDAEGDATVFDLNGSLSAVDLFISNTSELTKDQGVVKGVFYSVLPQMQYSEAPVTYYRIVLNACDDEDAVTGYVVEGLKQDATLEFTSAEAITIAGSDLAVDGYEWHNNAEGTGDALTTVTPSTLGTAIFLKKIVG